MANIALIIGNGFDIDLGLPSNYSQFITNKEWANVLKATEPLRILDDYREHSLIHHLMISATVDPLWFDIEREIDQFVVKHQNCSDKDVRDIKHEYNSLSRALTSYIVKWI